MAKIKMCKLEGTKWAVVKSNKKISKSLSNKLSKVRFGFTQENTFSFYFFNESHFNEIVCILNTYSKLKFEIVRFYDKQYGMTLNSWKPNDEDFKLKVAKMPLSKSFEWFNSGDRQSITPLTAKQFQNIIKIN